MSRPKSTHGNRRSWFGARPDNEQDVPEVPTIVHSTQYNRKGRDIPLTALPSGSTANKKYSSRGPIDALPTLPAMPFTVDQSAQSTTSSLPADKRRSRHATTNTLQRQPSMTSVKSKRRSRSSFWKSSNPDDSDSDVPPVPALYRGDSSESIRQETSQESIRMSRHETRTDNGKKPRPVSVVSTASRRSYVPRSAAKGFLKSTTGASDDTRKSFRKSQNIENDVDMVCLTDEQRTEWAKLMAGDLKLGDITSTPAADANKSNPFDEPKFSNSQALAALEFGTR